MKLTNKQNEILETFMYENPIDFLRHYPFRYEALYEKSVSEWKEGELVILNAKLLSGFKRFRFGKNQSRITFDVMYQDELIKVTIYNRPYLKELHYQNQIIITGTVQKDKSIMARAITNKDISTQTGIQAIYPLKKNIKQFEIKRLIKKILDNATIENLIPDTFIKRYRLMNRKDALRAVHLPKSEEEKFLGLRTLKYEEFLLYHLSNALKSKNLNDGIAKELNSIEFKNDIKNLPFSLTSDQIISLEEINHDISSTRQMNRLLQGDVGSGKTIVSLLAAKQVVLNGFQVAFMVPTEILLEQHEASLKRYMPNAKYVVLSSSKDNKKEILEKIENQEVDFVLGTHSLFQDDVIFKNLGLVIIDEQHRFGVKQRQKLINKGNKPDILMLSATPIPRSLAASIYFDLDVSTIQTYPSFRKEIKTFYIKENSIRTILPDIYKRLEAKDQIYIVVPSIEDVQNLGYRNVIDLYNNLKNEFKDYNLAYIHSQLDSDEKEQIMSDFAKHKIDILIATTIIEVGIDVKNANTMIIYNADMFGISTLHQLRGRIGRGEKQGVCYLLSDKENEETLIRLNSLVETNDGFKLSMQDLRLRGMGDILGERQSGLPSFILGDIEYDQNILNQAKLDAKEIIEDIDNTDYSKIVNILSE